MTEVATPYFDTDLVLGAMAHRRSMGLARLKPDAVDRGLIEKILEAGNWAPSHDETEPWRFSVFTGDGRRALGEAFGEAYRIQSGDAFEEGPFENYRDRVWRAPVWISVGVFPSVRPDGVYQTSEEEEAIAVGCAVQNMHIMAGAMELAGMMNSKFPYTDPHVARFVGLEPPARLLGFVFLGWPNIAWPSGTRGSIDEKVRWIES